MSLDPTHLGCRCGAVRLDALGAPIISADCCCTSCRAAAARLGALPSARPILDRHGATPFVLFRKDRVRFVAGSEHLAAFRLGPDATTRRVVATCCATPVYLDFHGGHWLSLYGALWPDGSRPHPALRTLTVDLPPGAALPDDVPNYRWQSFAFFVRLFLAWAAMGFRSPKIAVARELRA